MKVFTKIIRFSIIAIVIQYIWCLAKIDVLEDLNIFDGYIPAWFFLAGAILLFWILDEHIFKQHKQISQLGILSGTIIVILIISNGIIYLIDRSGFGMLVNTYWILFVGLYLLCARVIVRLRKNS